MQENQVKQYLIANRHRLSIKFIADEAGVDRTNLHKYLTPETYPSYHTMPVDYVVKLGPIVKALQTPAKASRRKSKASA